MVQHGEWALRKVQQEIQQAFGEGALVRLGEAAPRPRIAAISTGSLALDLALGVGGVPRGRVTEIFGDEGTGKSSLALHLIAEAQRQGGVGAYIDTEHVLDPGYAAHLGVRAGELLVAQPDWGEQALAIADCLVRSGAVDVVVVDSVAALVPQAEYDGAIGHPHLGLQAGLMSRALRRLVSGVARSATALVFINQLRQGAGSTPRDAEATPGGRALRCYSSVRVDLRLAGPVKSDGKVVGNRVLARVVKNKVAPPFRAAEIALIFGRGISRGRDLLELGLARGLVVRRGTRLLYGTIRLGQGRERAAAFLQDHPEVAAALEASLRAGAGALPREAQPRSQTASRACTGAGPVSARLPA